MKAYIGIKYHKDYRNKPTVDSISDALGKSEYDTSCIVRDVQSNKEAKYTPDELMKLTFEEIDKCNLVVIDLTEKGVGVGIEAGYAFAKGIPVITIAQKGADISETLTGISERVLFYDNIEDITNLFLDFK